MKNRILKSTIIQKEKNNEIMITSILIAFGINLFTSGILGFFNIEKNYVLLIIIGTVLSIIILLYYAILKIKDNNTEININGVIIYDEENNKIIDIPQYNISKDMVRYLASSFIENKALAQKWKSGRIGINLDEFNIDNNPKINNNIIIELIEYLFLSKLSIHLNDYYNINNIESKDINSLNFDEMPILLRKNRFLKLFSEEMENREAFINSNISIYNPEGKIIYAIGKKGEVFDEFNLKLPKEVKIIKEDLHKLKFIMKYFTLKIEYIFDGTNTIVDKEFYNYYLNKINKHTSVNEFKFKIKISIEFNNRIIFSNKKIQNYMWLDNLINYLMEYADINEFYKKINWESNKCFFRCLKNLNENEVVTGKKE